MINADFKNREEAYLEHTVSGSAADNQETAPPSFQFIELIKLYAACTPPLRGDRMAYESRMVDFFSKHKNRDWFVSALTLLHDKLVFETSPGGHLLGQPNTIQSFNRLASYDNGRITTKLKARLQRLEELCASENIAFRPGNIFQTSQGPR